MCLSVCHFCVSVCVLFLCTVCSSCVCVPGTDGYTKDGLVNIGIVIPRGKVIFNANAHVLVSICPYKCGSSLCRST